MSHKDPVARATYHREWSRRTRHRYAARHKALDAARHANARAETYGAPGRITADQAAVILAAGVCHYCSATPPLLTLDHVVGLHAGGANHPRNIVAACRPCNISKFRQEKPGRWAREHDACIDCGSTERKHICHGRCGRCYQRARKT